MKISLQSSEETQIWDKLTSEILYNIIVKFWIYLIHKDVFSLTEQIASHAS